MSENTTAVQTTTFPSFIAFLESLPVDSLIRALHLESTCAEAAMLANTTVETAADFEKAGTDLNDALEEGGYTSDRLVSAYFASTEARIELGNACASRGLQTRDFIAGASRRALNS